MSILYHSGKANMVVDSLSRLSIKSTSRVEEGKIELDKNVKRFACLGRLMAFTEGGLVVTNKVESSLVSKVKEKQDQGLILLDLKKNVHNQRVLVIEQGGDGMLKYQGRLCVPTVD